MSWYLRVSLSAIMVTIGLIAFDLAALRYATSPWDLGQPLRQPLLNLLPMTNALVVAGYGIIRSKGQPHRFAVGFIVGGSVALLIHAACDWAYPAPMWAICDWLATHCPNPFGKAGRAMLTYTAPGKGVFFRLYPAFALVISLPEFLVACVAGVVWNRRRAHRDRGVSLERSPE